MQTRLIEPAEIDAWVRSLNTPFLSHADDDSYQHWRLHLEPERTWAALDGGSIVGTCCVLSRDVTLPGPDGGPSPTIPMTAVSGVGVHPTHRRQGILRQMMGAMLRDGVARGEPLAGLIASEAVIYGRFGFGWATSTVDLSLPKRTARLTGPIPESALVLCDAEEAAKRLPPLFDRLRRNRPGQVDRNEAVWSEAFRSPSRPRTKTSNRFYAIGENGYTSYRAGTNWGTPAEPRALYVDDLFGATEADEAALWHYLLGVDLIDTIVAGRPLDEPLRWRLADPRGLAVTGLRDVLWTRVLDVPDALTARRYRIEGRLVLQVEPAPDWPGEGDPGADPAAGRFVLEAGPDGSSCRAARSADATELRLGVAELSAALLGGQDLYSRSWAGRVSELVPGALARADALFGANPLPFTTTGF